MWGAGIGAVWLVGRIVYAWGYYQAADVATDRLWHQLHQRYNATPGFAIWHHPVFGAPLKIDER